MAPAAVRSVHIRQHNSSWISTLKSHRARAHRKTMRSEGTEKVYSLSNSIPLWYHLLYPESTYCFTIFSSCFQSLPTIISLYVESIVNRTPCIQDTFSVSNIQESASSSEAAFTQSSVFHLSRDSSLKCINSKSEVLLSTHGAHQVSLAQKWQALWICRQVKWRPGCCDDGRA